MVRQEAVSVDWKSFAVVFGTVFVAELGDKTQLATLLFASDKEVGKWIVFFAASLALIATSALGVLGGTLISQFVSERTLRTIAGAGFIAIGVWTLWR
jgi:putative Ca2+/H+ antiporter (TMEM165/GDT1 family)